MERMDVTSLSSKGQVVIPQEIRTNMNLHPGEKFIVLGSEDTIVLKKLEMPSFKGFDKLLKKTRDFAKKGGVTPDDVKSAVKRSRK